MIRFLTLCFCVCGVAQAQQTIFNVPSADITAAHAVYVETESQFRTWSPRYWAGTNYAAVGVGHDTEIDATLYNTSAPASGNASLGMGFRSVIPIFRKDAPGTELSWTFGGQAMQSLQAQGTGYWVYSHLSGRLPKLKTRLTAGASSGTKQLFGETTTHAIAGVEQPLGKTFSALADWYSGNHSAGFMTVGPSMNLPKAFTVFLGVQRPNTSRVGRAGLTVELAKIF